MFGLPTDKTRGYLFHASGLHFGCLLLQKCMTAAIGGVSLELPTAAPPKSPKRQAKQQAAGLFLLLISQQC